MKPLRVSNVDQLRAYLTWTNFERDEPLHRTKVSGPSTIVASASSKSVFTFQRQSHARCVLWRRPRTDRRAGLASLRGYARAARRCARAAATAPRASSARRHPHDRVRPARSDAARTTNSPPQLQRQRHRGRRGAWPALPSRAMTVSRPNGRPTRLMAGLIDHLGTRASPRSVLHSGAVASTSHTIGSSPCIAIGERAYRADRSR